MSANSSKLDPLGRPVARSFSRPLLSKALEPTIWDDKLATIKMSAIKISPSLYQSPLLSPPNVLDIGSANINIAMKRGAFLWRHKRVILLTGRSRTDLEPASKFENRAPATHGPCAQKKVPPTSRVGGVNLCNLTTSSSSILPM